MHNASTLQTFIEHMNRNKLLLQKMNWAFLIGTYYVVAISSCKNLVNDSPPFDDCGNKLPVAESKLPPNLSITDIAYVSPCVGWLTGSQGEIYKTVDGGKNWSAQATAVTTYLSSLHFQNESLGVVVGGDGLILRTINGGKSWDKPTSPTSFGLSEVVFVDPNEWWAVGGMVPMAGQKSNIIIHSVDSGATWDVSYNGNEGSLSGVSFVGSLGWAVGNTSFDNFGPPLLLQTTNRGVSWSVSSKASFVGGYLLGVKFWNSTIGYAVGNIGVIKTSDSGNNWSVVYSGPGPGSIGLAVLGAGDVRTIASGKIIRSLDGGTSWNVEWEKEETQSQLSVRSLFFLNDSIGWAAGRQATILKHRQGNWSVLSP